MNVQNIKNVIIYLHGVFLKFDSVTFIYFVLCN